ncbi:MAG: hypothetical protein K2H64_05680 [Desulfovibrio sp.]|nr:hypothetical protein [Desulfovibrio sp.]
MSIPEILRAIRDSSLSEYEKGAKFERLILSWLKADPVYRSQLSNVWLWRDFPAKDQFGSHDLGIDLVARTRLGEYWAIQRKFYGDATVIDKPAVDSFVSASGRLYDDPFTGEKAGFSARYWVSTSDTFNANALETIRNQDPPIIRLTLEHMAKAAVDWDAIYKGEDGRKAPKNRFPIRKLPAKKLMSISSSMIAEN